MKNDTRMRSYGPVPNLSGLKLKVGSKQIRKALLAGEVNTVYLAQDADPAVTDPIAAIAQQMDVTSVWVESLRALGKACGIDVGAAAAAVVK